MDEQVTCSATVKLSRRCYIMSENDFPLVSPEPPDSDTTDKEEESHFTSPEQLRRHSPIASLITPIEQHDSTLESTDLLSVSPADSTSTLSLKSTSLVSSLFIEPISNVVVTPTTPPQLGNLWQALRSVRIATLLYSSVVTVMASLSFGYGIGFSSPTLHDLDENEGKHTYFRRTIYHDSFNVSNIICSTIILIKSYYNIKGWSLS